MTYIHTEKFPTFRTLLTIYKKNKHKCKWSFIATSTATNSRTCKGKSVCPKSDSFDFQRHSWHFKKTETQAYYFKVLLFRWLFSNIVLNKKSTLRLQNYRSLKAVCIFNLNVWHPFAVPPYDLMCNEKFYV